jgi:hypothetical protein
MVVNRFKPDTCREEEEEEEGLHLDNGFQTNFRGTAFSSKGSWVFQIKMCHDGFY